MTSPHWSETRAEAYRKFHFDFTETSLAAQTVIVAGGTGGLGAATVALLAREGANLVAGYRSNRARGEALRQAIETEFGRKITLVEGDIANPKVRRELWTAAEKFGAPVAGAAIFPGDPARVGFEDLDDEVLLTSLETNYVGPVLLAKEVGETIERSSQGGSVVLLASMQAMAAFPSSLNYAGPKAALVHAARILAQRWNRVRVNVVAPGATVTGMAEASVQSGKYDRYIEAGAIAR